jgi:hypothetical protein
MKKLFLFLFISLIIFFTSISALAKIKINGIAQKGGKSVQTSSLLIYKLMETFPSCTITIYKTGTTTLQTIYSTNSGAIKANPFTANSDASYNFYVDSGVRFDIKFSGTGISSPFTISDYVLFESPTNEIYVINDGTDLGVQINSADSLIGSGNSGTIHVSGGGTISSDVHVTSKHNLIFDTRDYQLALGTAHNSIIMFDSDVNIDGYGTIKQSTGNHDSNYYEFIAIQGYAQTALNGSTVQNVHVRNLSFKGTRNDFDSVRAGVNLGNCHHCSVENTNWDSWPTINISAGATSGGGNDPLNLGLFSEDINFENNTTKKCGSQCIAFVNTKNGKIVKNIILAPSRSGGPGVTAIDAEVNLNTDFMEDIIIDHNIIDSRLSELSPHGNGIAFQPGSSNSGISRITNNIINSLDASNIPHISNAIYLSSNNKDLVVANNSINGAGQAGISLAGFRNQANNNYLFNTGGSGASAPSIANSGQNSTIDSNTITSNVAGFNDSIGETGSATANKYTNNKVPNGSTLLGTSQVKREIRSDGNSYNYSANGANLEIFQDQIGFNGATSGRTNIKASAIAGATLLTLPPITDTLVSKNSTDILTNKTLNSPVINSPTGLTKGDVGLSAVTNNLQLAASNNLSDLASVSTAKTNLSLNNVDNTSDATKNAAVATLNNKSISGASNTLSNIGNSSLTNSSITIGSTNIPLGTTSTAIAGLSGGVNFGGSTLSTYTDSTCTLTLKFGGVSTGITTSSNVCKYAQIGNTVFLKLEMILTNKGSATGVATLTGLPVNASNTANFQQVGFLYLVGTFTGTTNVFTDTTTPSQLLLYVNNAGTGAQLVDTNFTNSSIIILNLSYSVN